LVSLRLCNLLIYAGQLAVMKVTHRGPDSVYVFHFCCYEKL